MVRSELDAGVPIIVVLYRGEDGKTISQDFLKDLDTLPKREVSTPIWIPALALRKT